MEGREMREWLDKMLLVDTQIVEQVQADQQHQRQQKNPQDRMFDAFVSSIIREFLMFIWQKQQTRVKQQQQQQAPPKPPGFNPQIPPPQQSNQQQ